LRGMEVGLTPEQFWSMTPREFHFVVKGYEFRLARSWDMTAASMSLLANINSAKGKKFKPADFHPLLDVTSSADDVREALKLLRDYNQQEDGVNQ